MASEAQEDFLSTEAWGGIILVIICPEHLEVHGRRKFLQGIALRRKLPQPLLEVPETWLVSSHRSPPLTRRSEQRESSSGRRYQRQFPEASRSACSEPSTS